MELLKFIEKFYLEHIISNSHSKIATFFMLHFLQLIRSTRNYSKLYQKFYLDPILQFSKNIKILSLKIEINISITKFHLQNENFGNDDWPQQLCNQANRHHEFSSLPYSTSIRLNSVSRRNGASFPSRWKIEVHLE